MDFVAYGRLLRRSHRTAVRRVSRRAERRSPAGHVAEGGIAAISRRAAKLHAVEQGAGEVNTFSLKGPLWAGSVVATSAVALMLSDRAVPYFSLGAWLNSIFN